MQPSASMLAVEQLAKLPSGVLWSRADGYSPALSQT